MLNFPTNPTVNQVFQRWQWDGEKWVTVGGGEGVYLPITGGTMLGPINLQADADQPMEPVTLQQLEAVPQPDLSGLATVVALNNGLATKLNLTGGNMSGPITLVADGSGSQAIRYSQLATALAPYLLLAGGNMTGPITLNADGSGSQAIRYSQLGAYSTTAQMNTAIGTAIGAIPPTDLTGVLHLTGGTMSGAITLNADATGSQAVRYSQMSNAISTAIGNIPPVDTSKYDTIGLTFSFAGAPTTGMPSGQSVWEMNIPFVFPVSIAANPSIQSTMTAPGAAAVTMTLYKNPGSTTLGTVVFNTDGSITPNWIAGATSFAIGDVIRCTASATSNTIAGFSITIPATRM